MKRTHRLVVPNGTYQKDGEEKTRWLEIGAVLQKDDGRKVVKLEALPISAEFDGWVQMFPIEDKSESGYEKAKQVAQDFKQNTQVESEDEPIDMSSIPF